MSLAAAAMNQLRKMLTGENNMVLAGSVPDFESQARKFQDINEAGLYLHIPFCKQICPYCPYNKEIYDPETAERYAQAVKKEIDFYTAFMGNKPVTSFYIGGGTPTTMLNSGLGDILEYIYRKFNMQCDIHMESHPNDLSPDNLNTIKALSVAHLSVGVESLQDKYLRLLKRPYTAKEVRRVLERAVNKGFKCFNADFIFALPGQTYDELEHAALELAGTGIDQVAAYPLFYFPYTRLGEANRKGDCNLGLIIKRRKMLRKIEDIFYSRNYTRTSVWAFTRKGVPKYCSVTVPLYVGLGASGSSYLRDIFYLNTFNVAEYIKRLEEGRMPIALALDLSESMQMAWWVYWRVYETRFRRSDFRKRFGRDFHEICRKYFKLVSLQGMIGRDDGDEIVLNDRGSFWLHALEDVFSLNYIGKLWGALKEEPWPEKVIL